MWAAEVARIHVHPVLIVVFFAVWSAMMGTYLHFSLRVAPDALRRWADAQGYQFVERKRAGVFDWYSTASGSGQHVYRVVVRDREGRERRGLVVVGTPYWWCTSSSRCPVEARWGAEVDPISAINKTADSILARLDGSAIAGLITTRRLVLGFAFMDLTLTCLVLAFEVMMLAGVGVGVDRLFGDSPSPQTRQDDMLATASFLGMFALYLPALVTLTAGGVGLIRRKPWGYYSHLAGAVCVAVSFFGIIYTIPALFVAIRPEFKKECLGKQVAKTPADVINGV